MIHNIPIIGQCYMSESGEIIIPLARAESHDVCDKERILTCDEFKEKYMTFNAPSIGIHDGRVSCTFCGRCE